MAPQLRLIFVHGISAEIVRGDYTVELCNLLRAKLTARGVLPVNATQDQIDGIVTFEHVNYSDVGQAEEEGWLPAYRQNPRVPASLPHTPPHHLHTPNTPHRLPRRPHPC